jgi:hypothetical protein
LLEVLEGLMEHDPQESVTATATASAEATES